MTNSEINKILYRLEDIKTKLLELSPKKSDKIIHKIGNKYKISSGLSNEYIHLRNNIYILVPTGWYDVILINIFTGYSWDLPVKVVDNTDITEDEFKRICGNLHTFTLVNTIIKEDN
jgi:hypothetical protein